MARQPLATVLAPLVRRDGDWLRCRVTGCDAYWGGFRPTAHVVAKAQAHRARKHGAVARPAAVRPQRRNAAAQAAPALAALTGNGLNRAMVGPRLGGGVTRDVFEYGPDLVVKFGKPHGMMGDGKAANLIEFRSYGKAPAHIREWLCPPLAVAPDGEWLIMFRAEMHCLTATQHDALRTALRGVVEDLHHGNVGLLNGRPVAIDFGFGAVPGENNRVRVLA